MAKIVKFLTGAEKFKSPYNPRYSIKGQKDSKDLKTQRTERFKGPKDTKGPMAKRI
jgi:hypothetical protein